MKSKIYFAMNALDRDDDPTTETFKVETPSNFLKFGKNIFLIFYATIIVDFEIVTNLAGCALNFLQLPIFFNYVDISSLATT